MHWGTKIGHIQLAAQTFRQRSLQKLDHQVLSLLPNINTDLIVREIYNNSTRIADTTAEVNILQGGHIAILAFRKHHLCTRWGRSPRLRFFKQNYQRSPIYLGVVGGWVFQVNNDSGPIADLNNIGRTNIAVIELNDIPSNSVYYTRKIKCNARGGLYRKTCRNTRQRLRSINPQDLDPTLNTCSQGLNRILRVRKKR